MNESIVVRDVVKTLSEHLFVRFYRRELTRIGKKAFLPSVGTMDASTGVRELFKTRLMYKIEKLKKGEALTLSYEWAESGNRFSKSRTISEKVSDDLVELFEKLTEPCGDSYILPSPTKMSFARSECGNIEVSIDSEWISDLTHRK